MTSERRIGDEAVRKATGHGWAHWFRLLDRWRAIEKGHPATAQWLRDEQGLSSWWSQMVTVRHELERKARVVGQRGKSYELSVTRSIAAPPARCFEVFLEPKEQSIWFTTKAKADVRVGGRYRNADGDEGEFLAIQPPRRIRFTWENPGHCPGTFVEVVFRAQGRTGTQVELTHGKLGSVKDRASMKRGWSWAMDSFRSYLETGAPIPNEAWEAKRVARRRKAKRVTAGR